MKARVGLGLVAILLVAMLAAADDPWKNANYQSWSDKDVQKIMKDSPWGREVVTNTTSQEKDNKSKLPGTVGSFDRPEQLASEWVNVVWWSSKTMRRAVVRKAMLGGNKFSDEAAKQFTETPMDEHVIVVWGSPRTLAALAKLEPADLMKTAFLDSPRLKMRIEPIDAGPVVQGNTPADKIRFHFPRKVNGQDTVTDQDTRLVFKWRLVRGGKAKAEDAEQFEVVFNPSKMISAGAADY